MNPNLLAKTAYASPKAELQTARSIEADVFAKVTARLKPPASDDKRAFLRLAQAVHENRQLWTTLAADVVGADNKLPPQLRAQIFYLAEFTDQHSRKVLAGEEDTDILVEVNTAIMRGLAGQGGTK